MPENDGRLRDDFRHPQERRDSSERRLQGHDTVDRFATRGAGSARGFDMRPRYQLSLRETRRRMGVSLCYAEKQAKAQKKLANHSQKCDARLTSAAKNCRSSVDCVVPVRRLPRIGDAFHDLGRVDGVPSNLTMLRPSVLKIMILGLLSPSAALALGLGDIHVESALHQPLAAQIEIVGATGENSSRLERIDRRCGNVSALRPGASGVACLDRADGASGRAGTHALFCALDRCVHRADGDFSGRPAFRERRVDSRIHGIARSSGLVRSMAAAEIGGRAGRRQATGSAARCRHRRPALRSDRTRRSPRRRYVEPLRRTTNRDTYTVARRDTLARIAGIAGAHSRSDRRKMMIAIFRANPSAFQTNLNNLRTGVTLHLPSVAELSNISTDEANREFAQQMAAWRSPEHRWRLQ